MKKEIIKSLIGIGGAILLTACSPSMTSSEYLEKGKSLLAENKNGAAIIELKNAIKQESSNAEARYMLGRAYLSQGDYVNAQKELEKALELNYSDENIIPKLAEVKFKLNDYEQTIAYADSAYSLTDENYIIVLTYAGMGSLYSGNFKRAKDYFDSAIQLSDNSLYGILSQGYLARSPEELSNAIDSINTLIENHENFADAYLLKGYLLQANEEYLEAAKAFTAYGVKRPKELSIMFFIAHNYLRAGAFDKAEPVIDSVLAVADGNAIANQMKAQLMLESKDYRASLDYASKAFQINNKLTNAAIIAGVSAYQVGKFEQAYFYLVKVKDIVPDGHVVKSLFIELQLKLGYEVEATNSLNELIDAGNVDSSIILFASNELAELGQSTEAKALLNKLESPENADTLMQSGFLKLKLEDVASGIDALEKSLVISPDSVAAQIALAIGYIKNSQYDLAIVIAKRLQESPETKADGLLLQASADSKQDKILSAKQALTEILQFEPSNTSALNYLGSIAKAENKEDEAFDYFTKVLTIQPEHVRALANLTSLIANSKEGLDKAIVFYQKSLSNQSNNYLKFGLAHAYSLREDYQQALDLYTEIENSTEPLNGIEIMKGDMHNALNNYDDAIREYKAYFEQDKKNLNAGHRITAIYEKTKQYKKAIAHLDIMSNHHNDKLGMTLLKNYFQTLVGEKVSQSDLNAIAVSSLKQTWINELVLGNMALSNQNYDEALLQFNSAYSKQPTIQPVIGLVKALTLSGKVNAVVNLLEKHLEKDKDNIEVNMMLANAYITTGQGTKAIRQYKDILTNDNNNVLALNNLSYLELEQGNKATALEHINRAVGINPDSVILLDTLGEVLTANGEYQQALNAFNKAIHGGAGTNVSINKAKTLLLANKPVEAKQLLSSLTTDDKREKEQIFTLLQSLK